MKLIAAFAAVVLLGAGALLILLPSHTTVDSVSIDCGTVANAVSMSHSDAEVLVDRAKIQEVQDSLDATGDVTQSDPATDGSAGATGCHSSGLTRLGVGLAAVVLGLLAWPMTALVTRRGRRSSRPSDA